MSYLRAIESELQIAFDGREVPIRHSRGPRLTPAQREIVRMAVRQGKIRPLEAGAIMHAHRKHHWERNSTYWSSDGADALKRLARRGIVVRIKRGDWRPLCAEERPFDWEIDGL
jgi:hypothetical protein